MKASILPRIRIRSSSGQNKTVKEKACAGQRKPLNLITAVRRDEEAGQNFYMLYHYNEAEGTDTPNPDSFGVTARYVKGTTMPFYRRPGRGSTETVPFILEETHDFLMVLNPWSGEKRRILPEIIQNEDGEKQTGFTLQMEEDDLVILCGEERHSQGAEFEMIPMHPKGTGERCEIAWQSLTLIPFLPGNDEYSFLSGTYEEKKAITIHSRFLSVPLQPFHRLPGVGETFAGKGIYEGIAEIEDTLHEEAGLRWILCLDAVSDTFHVEVNGRKAPFPDQDRKEVDVTELLRAGENRIRIVVTTTLERAVVGPVAGETDFVFGQVMPYQPKNDGITGYVCLEGRMV